jgi:hypothetical protein
MGVNPITINTLENAIFLDRVNDICREEGAEQVLELVRQGITDEEEIRKRLNPGEQQTR